MAGKRALVLGAGGARGIAHLGLLQVLRREGLAPDLVVGCSAGAIFGALWAVNADLDRMERLLLWPGFTRRMFDLAVSREGLVKGDSVLEAMRLFTKNAVFADLAVELAIVATDIQTGELVVFREGNVAEAVRASVSIPGFFQPYQYQGRRLVDGAVKNRLPVQVARELGAGQIVAVDVKKNLMPDPRGALNILLQSIEILEEEVFRSHAGEADLLIQPEVGHIGSLQFERAAEAIELGRAAALAKSSEIRRFLE